MTLLPTLEREDRADSSPTDTSIPNLVEDCGRSFAPAATPCGEVGSTQLISARSTERHSSWWGAAVAVGVVWVALFIFAARNGFADPGAPTPGQGLVMLLLHLPYVAILTFLAFGFWERIGFFWNGRAPARAGQAPDYLPKICVQLPMFNEQAVARRVINAAVALDWPIDRLVIQVLDDSTDANTRTLVQGACAEARARTGVACEWIHRTNRFGYKAGALEAGRHQTDAEFIAIFDADFMPPRDYLRRAVAHFYDERGQPISDLALVQAQWGHLNADESALTGAQALWVDDHHTLQQSWRSSALRFVNFTGTAGLWRASAIEAAGGWRSASLVEDCELSFRVLFAGYRTQFVKEIVVPAELPQTLAAYRLQQKRWTQGWAQLQRLHLRRLVFEHRTPWRRKAPLVYLTCISWQWPLWMAWVLAFPFVIAGGWSLSAFGMPVALAAYLGPPVAFAMFAALIATLETRHTYSDDTGAMGWRRLRRFARLFPFMVVNAGMLAHHVCAFLEGLFGPLHAEFERTPKTASVVAPTAMVRPAAVQRRASSGRPSSKRPVYQATEAALFGAQLCWTALFFSQGMTAAALGAAWLAVCVAALRLAPRAKATLRQRRRRGR